MRLVSQGRSTQSMGLLAGKPLRCEYSNGCLFGRLAALHAIQ
jgi:hypothetical protein